MLQPVKCLLKEEIYKLAYKCSISKNNEAGTEILSWKEICEDISVHWITTDGNANTYIS